MADRLELRVPARRLLIGLAVTVVPISVLALYGSARAGVQAEELAGSHLQTIAQSVAMDAAAFVRAKVIEAALMASDSAVREAAVTANDSLRALSEDQRLARIKELDEKWNTPEGERVAAEILASRASEALRATLAVDPAFLRITVTDGHGATIAASHKTLDYYQADEQYWKAIYADGRGGVSLTDVLYDEATRTHYIGVGVPVIDENNAFIGTLDALVEVSALFPLLYRSDLGPAGYAALVRTDGSLIAGSDGGSIAGRSATPEYSAVQDAKQNFVGRSAGHFVADFPQRGETIVAFADVGLADEFQQLDWRVVASQDGRQVLGAVAGLQLLFMAGALLSLASVVFLAVYFQLHTHSEIEEFEELGHSDRSAAAHS